MKTCISQINKIHSNEYNISMLDRFVPPRTSNKFNNLLEMPAQQSVQPYQKLIAKEMLNDYKPNAHSSKPYSFDFNNFDLQQDHNFHQNRCINPNPEKVLDAPDLKDDYYLNLLDWSSKDILAIGLSQKVYLYSPKQIVELCQIPDDEYVCSLSYHPEGLHLSVGLSTGKTQIYDIERQTLIRTLKGHTQRVSSSSFTYGLLYTGSKDSQIIGHDYRAYHNVVTKMTGHRGQVCGLKHDACGLASGSNDNLCIIWDVNMTKPRYQLQGHKAAVKALAWCPWQRNLLATGGGSTDKTMRFWNIETGKCVNIVETESQVCSLLWNKEHRQIISSHGYINNQISIWRVGKQTLQYPLCNKVAQLHGHKKRVLHMVQTSDQSTLCSASADETLRFWKLFDQKQRYKNDGKFSSAKVNLDHCALR